MEGYDTAGIIHVSSIIDVAFIFHANALEKEFVNCAGMSRLFYTHYRIINGRLLAIDHRLHFPFSRVCGESFPSWLWYVILEVKSKIEKLLHDTKQFQCCKKLVMTCTQECWNYLHFCMAISDAVFFNYCRNYTEKNVHPGLSLSSSCTIKVLHLLHIDSELSLNCTRNLFGLTFGIGITNRAPRKGEDPVTIHHGDVVNIVDITTNNALDHTVEFISSQCVDFLYEEAK